VAGTPNVQTAAGKALLFAVWVAAVAALGWYVSSTLKIGTDLRLFMPSPRNAQERLILEEIGESPASRMLLLSISGGSAEDEAESSRALTRELRSTGDFATVSNGETDLSAIPDSLLAYRYLLSPTLDDNRMDATFLRSQLIERVQDLGSPAAGFLEPWLPRDPTLEVMQLAESWLPAKQPQLQNGVWFDSSGREALLIVQTQAAAFDPSGQKAAQSSLQGAFEQARTDPTLKLEASGPGAFSVLMQQRTESEAQVYGSVDTIGIIVLLLVAYRSLRILVLGLLPLLSAAAAGLAAVAGFFGTVHGITLAFGFTLIGVAQDYPVHLFSHQHKGLDPVENSRVLWPTLATGVASTCIAYLAFLFSGVTGLAQLSVFTFTGLAVAALTTRFLVPPLMPEVRRDPGDSAFLGRLWHGIAGLPRPLWLGVVGATACVGFLWLSPQPLWQNDLGSLTPVPGSLIARDTVLRAELGAPDVRHLLVIEGQDAQAALERTAALGPALDKLVAEGAISSFNDAARYLPTKAAQERRRARLPAAGQLRSDLATALQGMPFRPGVFEPFLMDVERARSLPALGPEDLAGTPLASLVGGLLLDRGGHWISLVTLSDVKDASALSSLAGSGVTLLDLRQASESLVEHQRQRILWCLAISAVLLAVVVSIALKAASRVLRVLAPMALTTLIIVTLLHAAGISLNLFHLISLVLAAGLGLDYALFFEHASDDPAMQRRTLHAVIVCSLATVLVFALLSFSTLPVLRSIGTTVAIGVVSNFVLALLLTRSAGATDSGG
jgi:predicted exporter